MITQAVNNVANPQVNQRILNIVRVNDYCGTDTEDPYEWIQSVEKAAQANNWNDAKTLQVAISALQKGANQWHVENTVANNNPYGTFGQGGNDFKTQFLAKFASPTRKSLWRIELRNLVQGNLTVDQYANKIKALIARVDPAGVMPDDEKVAYVIAGAGAVYQPFLFAANPQNVDAAFNIMRSMESGAKVNASNSFLETRINQLEAQLMTLNANPSVDKQMNPYRNESRYNRDQRNYQNRQNCQSFDRSQIVCYRYNERGHFARDCLSQIVNPPPSQSQQTNNFRPALTQILQRPKRNNPFREQIGLNYLEPEENYLYETNYENYKVLDDVDYHGETYNLRPDPDKPIKRVRFEEQPPYDIVKDISRHHAAPTFGQLMRDATQRAKVKNWIEHLDNKKTTAPINAQQTPPSGIVNFAALRGYGRFGTNSVQVLFDTGLGVSIISHTLAKKLKLPIRLKMYS